MEASGTVNGSKGVDNPVSCPDSPVIVERLEVEVCSILAASSAELIAGKRNVVMCVCISRHDTLSMCTRCLVLLHLLLH